MSNKDYAIVWIANIGYRNASNIWFHKVLILLKHLKNLPSTFTDSKITEFVSFNFTSHFCGSRARFAEDIKTGKCWNCMMQVQVKAQHASRSTKLYSSTMTCCSSPWRSLLRNCWVTKVLLRKWLSLQNMDCTWLWLFEKSSVFPLKGSCLACWPGKGKEVWDHVIYRNSTNFTASIGHLVTVTPHFSFGIYTCDLWPDWTLFSQNYSKNGFFSEINVLLYRSAVHNIQLAPSSIYDLLSHNNNIPQLHPCFPHIHLLLTDLLPLRRDKPWKYVFREMLKFPATAVKGEHDYG